MPLDPAPPSSRPVANDVSIALERRLKAETEGEVLFDGGSRGRYATDASVYQVMPVGVLVPKTDRDVETAIAVARDLNVPVLPRGGGTSQCGQTTGAALVVDDSKHLRRVLDVDVENRTAVVEPGLVLDHLNAQLKPHGLWFPVDVSTSAQATLGGMAGNNSCGSRSIAYGNMVHNTAGIDAWLSDGSAISLGPLASLGAKEAALAEFVRDLATRHRDAIVANWPKVLRRVAGYNLDLFDPQSEKPYTDDGSVNLAHLLVGSEGTLAFTRRLTLRLSPLPTAKVLGVVNFPTFRAAMDAAQHLVKLGPVAVELVDRTMIDLALANPAFRPAMETALIGRPEAILLVEFTGFDKAALLPKLPQLVELMGDLGLPGSVVEMADDAVQKALWEVRKAGLNIMMSLKGDGKPISFIEDCAVPLEHLADYTDALTETFARHGTRGTWYAHASVGTLHVRPIIDLRTGGPDGGAAKMRAIAEEAAALVRKYKGAFSGEHGDGLCRGEWVRWQFGPAIDDAFRAIKHRLDPIGLFAPNRIVDPPKMDDGSLFRYPPPDVSSAATGLARRPYRTIPLKTVLDWSAWDVTNDPRTEEVSAPGTGGDVTGGFAKAVEMCNNNGHCRKFDAGTMCPSYRVTRDEQHLTRGRANTLRLALSGQLPTSGAGADARALAGSTGDAATGAGLADDDAYDAFTSQQMYDTLDLCVSCKGCKRDCPTGVDMARMKIEFLAHYKRRHGWTLKDGLIAKLPDYAAAASRMPGLMNLREKSPMLRKLGERWLGLSADRSLPRWRRDTFWRGLATGRGPTDRTMSGDRVSSERAPRRASPTARDPIPFASADETLAIARQGGHAAVLFVDTFNGTFEAENAWAAARVLHAAGYAVHTVRKAGGHHCCGRTYLASGMVDAAKAKVGALVAALRPFAEAGIAIVGLEPSCLLTLRDEALVMGLGEVAEVVSKQALLFEEFVAREAKAGRFALKLKAADAPILLHGHCHQKAFGAVSPIVDVLKLIPGAKPELIESSCCGMAGSFGYEARHHDVSMAMAEASLLPAIRKQPDAIVVADGTSCRHQIHDGAQRDAVHVALLLERLLVG